MMHGDISNEICDTVAFRCIGTLFKVRERSLKEDLLNFLWGKERRMIVNDIVLHAMETIYRNTEMCVDLIVFEHEYTDALKEVLNDIVPYNRIVRVDKVSQISIRLMTGDIAYYVDDDSVTRERVNNPYAIPFSELTQTIKFKRRYKN